MDERSWRPAEPDCVGWSRPLPRPQLTPTSSGGGWSGFHTSGSASFGSDTTTSGRVCSMPFHSSQAFTPVLFALMLPRMAAVCTQCGSLMFGYDAAAHARPDAERR